MSCIDKFVEEKIFVWNIWYLSVLLLLLLYEIVRNILKVCELSIHVNNSFGKSLLNLTAYRI
jgi:hypothetical protein